MSQHVGTATDAMFIQKNRMPGGDAIHDHAGRRAASIGRFYSRDGEGECYPGQGVTHHNGEGREVGISISFREVFELEIHRE